MYTLIKSNLIKDVQKIIIQNITLFDSYDNVYLFGSTINKNVIPKDIDLLLVYSEYAKVIANRTKEINSILEDILNFPVDLTILSFVELKSTGFLKKIKTYIKLK